jgi:5-methyltetrahydropteroyltriglutamate--homocysteine methyltransferase
LWRTVEASNLGPRPCQGWAWGRCDKRVHICYSYGIPANIEWKATLGGEWRQYEKFFRALAKSRIYQVSLERIN